MAEMRTAYKISVRNPEGKRPLGRPRSRQEDNTELVKVKLSLCFLTKHHAMKVYWGSGCIAPLIL
jgi:hypothetical protein